MRGMIFAVAVAVSTGPVRAQEAESYLCVEEIVTGFTVNEATGQWRDASFIADAKFIVRPKKADEFEWLAPEAGTTPYVVIRVGSRTPSYVCRYGVDGGVCIYSSLFERLGTFELNTSTLRYTRTYVWGWNYQHPDDGQVDDDTPLIAIGSCSPL